MEAVPLVLLPQLWLINFIHSKIYPNLSMKTLIKIISIIGFSMAVQNASAVSGSYCLNAEFADFNLVGETLEPGGSTSALLDIRAGTVDHDYDSLGFDNSVDHITDGAVMFLFKDRTTGEKSKFGIDLGDFISDFSVNESFSLTYNSGVFIGNIICLLYTSDAADE